MKMIFHTTELKPCPFCGGEAHLERHPGRGDMGNVNCVDCGARSHWFKTAPQAIAAWNLRSDGWIPCVETLPLSHVPVLACDGNNSLFIASQVDGEWSDYEHDTPLNHITHWQQPPAPPKNQ
jgi:Lar family restriction alleviation protein